MLVYNYKNKKIRCINEDGIYYFALIDVAKLYPVSRSYLSRIGKELGAFVHRVKGDTRNVLYLRYDAFKSVGEGNSFAKFFVEMMLSFDENNVEEFVGNFGKKKLTDYNVSINIDKLLKKVIVKIVDNTYYFNLTYLGKELGMSPSWAYKRFKSEGLDNIVNYKGLQKFFSKKPFSKNKYVLWLYDFVKNNDSFDLVKLRSSFKVLEKKLK